MTKLLLRLFVKGAQNPDDPAVRLAVGKLAGVVGIPRNAFMPHTPIKTSILFLQKRDRPRAGSEPIFFGISERSGKDSRGNLRFRDGESRTWRNVDHDLAEIAGPFRAFLRREGMDW